MAPGKQFYVLDTAEKNCKHILDLWSDAVVWKAHVLPYLKDLEKLMTLVGNHTYVSALKILIVKGENNAEGNSNHTP